MKAKVKLLYWRPILYTTFASSARVQDDVAEDTLSGPFWIRRERPAGLVVGAPLGPGLGLTFGLGLYSLGLVIVGA